MDNGCLAHELLTTLNSLSALVGLLQLLQRIDQRRSVEQQHLAVRHELLAALPVLVHGQVRIVVGDLKLVLLQRIVREHLVFAVQVDHAALVGGRFRSLVVLLLHRRVVLGLQQFADEHEMVDVQLLTLRLFEQILQRHHAELRGQVDEALVQHEHLVLAGILEELNHSLVAALSSGSHEELIDQLDERLVLVPVQLNERAQREHVLVIFVHQIAIHLLHDRAQTLLVDQMLGEETELDWLLLEELLEQRGDSWRRMGDLDLVSDSL